LGWCPSPSFVFGLLFWGLAIHSCRESWAAKLRVRPLQCRYFESDGCFVILLQLFNHLPDQRVQHRIFLWKYYIFHFFCGAKFSWNKSRWLRDNKSRNNQKLLKFIGLRECHHLIFFVQWLYTTYIGSSLFTDVKQAKMSKKYGKASHLSVRGKFCGCV
jgi:hypothetical protein